eukprot:3504304-Prymnesium_polylepis.1
MLDLTPSLQYTAIAALSLQSNEEPANPLRASRCDHAVVSRTVRGSGVLLSVAPSMAPDAT